MARKSLKKPPRCSGNSAKSLLIMSSVGSKTASRIGAICGERRFYTGQLGDINPGGFKSNRLTPSLPTMTAMTFRTSASRAAGTLRL